MEGSFLRTIDEKGRLHLPAKIKNIVGKNFICALGEKEGEVLLFSQEAWNKKLKTTEDPDSLRETFRPCETVLDSQGRIIIPQIIRKLKNINGLVWIVLKSDYIKLTSGINSPLFIIY